MRDAFVRIKRLRRFGMSGLAMVLIVGLTSCTGRGGGVLPPSLGYIGQATIGFSFTCENGRLSLSLEYQDHATNPFGGPFSIHGVADKISPALESYFCVGDASNGDLPAGEILFQGTYTVQSGRPGMFDPNGCADTLKVGNGDVLTGCRFTADVRDTGNRGPSKGDYLSITLFGGPATPDTTDTTPLAPLLYSREGYLASGNFQVDNP